MKETNPNPFRHNERGQSLIEFAVAFVILMMLLVGIVDLGRGFFTYMTLRDAAQEGAAYGSLYPTQAITCTTYDPESSTFNDICIRQRVRAATTSPVDLTNTDISVSLTLVGGDACAGNGLKVDVEYDFPLIMPFFTALMGTDTIPLHATVTDEILRPSCP
jgi:hypothetical protein